VVGSCVFVTSLSIILAHRFMFGLMPVFDLDREATIPAGYTALLLLSSAVLLILIARIERLQGGEAVVLLVDLVARVRLPGR
jgi:hypothetical protein